MTIAQNLFAVFYGVLYAAMLSSLTGLFAFPWGFPAEANGKVRLVWRLFLSIVCFNILPFLIFAWGFQVLGEHKGSLTYIQVLVVALASLSVYAPYRLYTLLLVLFGKNTCLRLYSADDYDKVTTKRSIRTSVCGNIIAVLFYGVSFFFVYFV